MISSLLLKYTRNEKYCNYYIPIIIVSYKLNGTEQQQRKPRLDYIYNRYNKNHKKTENTTINTTEFQLRFNVLLMIVIIYIGTFS